MAVMLPTMVLDVFVSSVPFPSLEVIVRDGRLNMEGHFIMYFENRMEGVSERYPVVSTVVMPIPVKRDNGPMMHLSRKDDFGSNFTIPKRTVVRL